MQSNLGRSINFTSTFAFETPKALLYLFSPRTALRPHLLLSLCPATQPTAG